MFCSEAAACSRAGLGCEGLSMNSRQSWRDPGSCMLEVMWLSKDYGQVSLLSSLKLCNQNKYFKSIFRDTYFTFISSVLQLLKVSFSVWNSQVIPKSRDAQL